MQQSYSGSNMTPVVKNLIIINVIFFILTHYIFPNLFDLTALYYPGPGSMFRPYQLITYMFSHGGIMHILFNMYALFIFGSFIEQYWGPKKFLIFYLACGIGSPLINYCIDYIRIQQILSHNPGDFMAIAQITNVQMVGASGAIFGVLAAFGFMFPNLTLNLLFPPIPLKAKYFVMIYAGIEIYSGFASVAGDNVAHFAHIGGLVTGLILLLYLRQQGKLYNQYW